MTSKPRFGGKTLKSPGRHRTNMTHTPVERSNLWCKNTQTSLSAHDFAVCSFPAWGSLPKGQLTSFAAARSFGAAKTNLLATHQAHLPPKTEIIQNLSRNTSPKITRNHPKTPVITKKMNQAHGTNLPTTQPRRHPQHQSSPSARPSAEPSQGWAWEVPRRAAARGSSRRLGWLEFLRFPSF